ncbi:MAG: hypothetical protein IPK72_21375 [Candidatus Eisenbacteria bacterium]|nr:hypothetical protein [Candidatus Eisenbacteria bacterium]
MESVKPIVDWIIIVIEGAWYRPIVAGIAIFVAWYIVGRAIGISNVAPPWDGSYTIVGNRVAPSAMSSPCAGFATLMTILTGTGLLYIGGRLNS